jgi:hypothetical protein
MKKFINLLHKIDSHWYILRHENYDILIYGIIILIAIVSVIIAM